MTSGYPGYLAPKCVVKNKEGGERGVFAARLIPAGELIAIWGGERLSREELDLLAGKHKRYSLQVDEDAYLVSLRAVHDADLINHSCDPNAGLSGASQLVALRDIFAGEEVCYDYAMSDGSEYDEFACSCGSPRCRGHIRGSDWRRWDLRLRYGSNFSPYLLRRMALMEVEVSEQRSPEPGFVSLASFL